MKKILFIAWKDTALRFASGFEWLFFLVLPIVFTLVLAGGTGSGAGQPRPAGGGRSGAIAALGGPDGGAWDGPRLCGPTC